MRNRANRASVVVISMLAVALTGCNNGNESGESAPPPEKSGKKEQLQVAGKWSGTWESSGHKGHGGGLTCEAIESGKQKWEATFTAEFGKTKAYKVKLEGKPGDGKVVFGGKVDLGKDDGGEFTWTGQATATDFTGEYDGGGDKGSFKMTRIK
jgi:hypothetical protein